jgi:hypothetical protein
MVPGIAAGRLMQNSIDIPANAVFSESSNSKSHWLFGIACRGGSIPILHRFPLRIDTTDTTLCTSVAGCK